MALILLVLAAAGDGTLQGGIDWGQGVVRIPAPVVELASGEKQTLFPTDNEVVTYLLGCLWDIALDGDTKVKESFESPRDFCNVMSGVPGTLSEGFLHVPFDGEEGIVERILHPEHFRKALPAVEPSREEPGQAESNYSEEEAQSMGMVVSERV